MIKSRREIIARIEQIRSEFIQMVDSNKHSNLPAKSQYHRLEEMCWKFDGDLKQLIAELGEESPPAIGGGN